MLYGIYIIMIIAAFLMGRHLGFVRGLKCFDDELMKPLQDKYATFKEETYKTIDAFKKEIQQLRKRGGKA